MAAILIPHSSKIVYHMYQENLLSKLPTAGAAFDHFDNQADVACHPNTRVELLKTIYEWTHDTQGPKVFWLQGLAGTGKSTISHTVARDLRGDALGASFFFKRGDGERDNARHLFTTIAYQLARKLPLLCKHICDAIENEPRIIEGYLSVQFQGLVLGPLKKLQDQGFTRTLLVVIDALDECEQETHRETIIDLLTKSQLRNLKVFVTSRPEFDIRNRFSCANGTYRDLVLHRVDEHIVEHDIRVVLEYHMSKFRRGTIRSAVKTPILLTTGPAVRGLKNSLECVLHCSSPSQHFSGYFAFGQRGQILSSTFSSKTRQHQHRSTESSTTPY